MEENTKTVTEAEHKAAHGIPPSNLPGEVLYHTGDAFAL